MYSLCSHSKLTKFQEICMIIFLSRLCALSPNASSVDMPEKPCQPHEGYAFPMRSVGGSDRLFQSFWFTTWDWIHYDCVNDLAFCHVCSIGYRLGLLALDKPNNALILGGYSDWRHASRDFKAHTFSVEHKRATDIKEIIYEKVSINSF